MTLHIDNFVYGQFISLATYKTINPPIINRFRRFIVNDDGLIKKNFNCINNTDNTDNTDNWHLQLPLPPNTTHIMFNDLLTNSMDKILWTPNITHIYLCNMDDQSIDKISWPPFIELLMIQESGNFNHPIDKVVWPPYLKSLSIESGTFNQSIDKIVWPPYLEELVIGGSFNHPIDNVLWPPHLNCRHKI